MNHEQSLIELMQAVRRMRNLQIEFFSGKKHLFREAKRAEDIVDEKLKKLETLTGTALQPITKWKQANLQL
jgi:hypothetical protein